MLYSSHKGSRTETNNSTVAFQIRQSLNNGVCAIYEAVIDMRNPMCRPCTVFSLHYYSNRARGPG